MLETDNRFSTLSAAQTMAMYQEVRRRIAAIPGVESVALTRGLPMRMTGQRLVVDGAAGGSSRRAGMFWAGPEFFETLQIPLIDGRTFDARDRAGTPRVAVINETMAREYFGSVNAVGRRFRMESPADSWMEVVGVVRDTGADLLDPVPHVFYRSFTQSDTLPTTVVARTSQAAGTLLPVMQRELRAVDATLPVISARTMAQDRQDALRGSQAIAMALGGLGMLGVVLASIGLYAVVAFVVARRSREIGIRMAIGARGPHVIWNVTRGVAGLVGAAFVPARRAALTDPLAALRQD
jgi:hypothetical protein